MNTLSNTELIVKLKSGNTEENQKAMTYLYVSLYGKVQNFVLRNNGQKSDAKDVFQDGLLAFFNLVKENKIKEDLKVEAYVFSICRNFWLKQLNNKKKAPDFTVGGELKTKEQEAFSQQVFSVDKTQLIEQVINKLTHGCKTIVLAFYFKRMTMEEIMKTMNLSSIQAAKNKKYMCIQKLKKIVLESPYYKNNLKD